MTDVADSKRTRMEGCPYGDMDQVIFSEIEARPRGT